MKQKILKLNSQKAYKKLKWKTLLNLDQIGIFITNWYKIYFLEKIQICMILL